MSGRRLILAACMFSSIIAYSLKANAEVTLPADYPALNGYPCERFAALVQGVVDLGPKRLIWWMRKGGKRFHKRDYEIVMIAWHFAVTRELKGKGSYSTAFDSCRTEWWKA